MAAGRASQRGCPACKPSKRTHEELRLHHANTPAPPVLTLSPRQARRVELMQTSNSLPTLAFCAVILLSGGSVLGQTPKSAAPEPPAPQPAAPRPHRTANIEAQVGRLAQS